MTRPEDIMLTDLRINLLFYALKYANYASNMFPIIPALCSYTQNIYNWTQDWWAAQYAKYKTNKYYDMQKTTQKLGMTSILTHIIRD